MMFFMFCKLVRAVILCIVPPHALDTHSKATVVCIFD